MADSRLTVAELGGVEVKGFTRGAFLVRGALAAGAVYGAGAISPFVREALAQEGGGDVEVLNFALTLELLEADFYRQAQELDLDGDVMELAKLLGRHEQAHVDVLTKTIQDLGGTPGEEPTFTFPMEDQASFLELAQTLEDTGVSAYNGAAPMIETTEVLAAAGSIVQVEARHAAAIRLQTKEPPAPNAFDETLGMDAVLEAVKPFVKA